MSTELHVLVEDALEIAKEQGLSQKELAEKAAIGEAVISRLKKADDARISTLTDIGRTIGKKLIWVDDNSDLAELVRNGDLFEI